MSLLNNEHILLRAPEPEDLDCFYRWENDTALWKYGAALSPFSRYALKEYLASVSPDIYKDNQLRFMIENCSDGAVMGSVDLYDFEPHHRRAGVGVLIDPAFHRRGIATEAIQLIAGYAFEFLHIHQLYAHIPISNVPSVALFGQCGFVETGKLKDWITVGNRYEDVSVMQRIVNG